MEILLTIANGVHEFLLNVNEVFEGGCLEDVLVIGIRGDSIQFVHAQSVWVTNSDSDHVNALLCTG